MNLATINDIEKINTIFKPYLKDIFPHLRYDYIQRKILSNKVVLEDDVVIIFGKYVKRQKVGDVNAKPGDAYISQIASIKGNATFVLNKFFKWVNSNVWLTVRKENNRARSFYEKNGMKEVGKISWKEGTLPGVVYFKKK